MAQSILTNTAIATIGRLLNLVLGVIVIALVTRLLGPAQFGQYTLVLAYGTILQLIADAGLYLTLTRELSTNPQQRSEYTAHVLSLRLVLLLITLGLGLAAFWLVPANRNLSGVLGIASVGLIVQSLSQLLMGIYQVYSVVWRATISDLIGRLGQVVVIVLLSRLSANPLGMISAFTIGAGITFGMHVLLLPIRDVWRWRYSQVVWSNIMRVSWPLGLMLLMNAIYFRIDAVILAYFRTATEVGYYGLAYRVVESALFFPAMFGGLLLPALSAELSKHHIQRARQLLSQAFHIVVVIALWVILIVQVGAELIISWLTNASGTVFMPAVPLLQILALALAIMFLGNILGYALVALKQQKALLYLYAGLALGNTSLNIWLIPHFGSLAAAWITVLTESIAMVVAYVLVTRKLAISFPINLASRLAITVLLTVGLYHLLPAGWSSLVQVSVLSVVYGGLVWALKIMQPQDITLLMARPKEIQSVPLQDGQL